ncbi:E3 ubiquitin-protein ligase rnf13 [Trifolium repens]|jgi:hypothetical protein|nr:hypoxia-responsive family protein / zinc finger (C3HC4-type RING finger) family protein [Trifolium repens]WJX43833.1 E3 ubiquitin-protein ligase rnf13 [Trifolium repens]
MRRGRVLGENENQTFGPDIKAVYWILGCLVFFNVAYWVYFAIRKWITSQNTPRVEQIEMTHASQNAETLIPTAAATTPHNRSVHVSEVLYKTSITLAFNQKACAICLEEYLNNEKLYMFVCGHAFHKDCITTYLRENYITCPVCRWVV